MMMESLMMNLCGIGMIAGLMVPFITTFYILRIQRNEAKAKAKARLLKEWTLVETSVNS
jgi:hypothetical protein